MKKIISVFESAIVLFLVSCATSIPVTLTKPALVDLSGVQKISVLPFGYANEGVKGDYLSSALYRSSTAYRYRSTYEQTVATTLTNTMNSILLESKEYTVVSASELSRLASSSGDYTTVADAILSGEITFLVTNNTDGYEDIKGSDGVVRPTYFLNREVTLEFTYRFIRTSDGSIIDQIVHQGRASDKKYGDKAYSTITSEIELARSIIADMQPRIRKEIAPWKTTEYRSLEADKTKDPRMEEADKLVKDGQYVQALAVFSDVYSKTGNFAAGFNAAIMTEILGDLEKAIVMMQALADSTANPHAVSELERMQQTLADRERLEASK